MSENKALITQLGGKLQAAGVVFVAASLIASVSGMWWGPGLLLPGVLLIIIGRF
jgi:hypothetical protein